MNILQRKKKNTAPRRNIPEKQLALISRAALIKKIPRVDELSRAEMKGRELLNIYKRKGPKKPAENPRIAARRVYYSHTCAPREKTKSVYAWYLDRALSAERVGGGE